MDRQTEFERLEEMKQRLSQEREKYKYDLNEPVEPIKNKSGVGRAILSVVAAGILIAVCAVLISMLALQNAGVGISFLL